MSHGEPTLVMFHGPPGTGDGERMLEGAKVAAARAQLELAKKHGITKAIVVTSEREAFDGVGGHVTLDVDAVGEDFEFGTRLAEVVARYAVETPVVMGAGALPLLDGETFERMVTLCEGAGPGWVTNNFFSSDLVGWKPGAAAALLKGVTRDNQLPRRLRDVAGLQGTVLPRTTATTFDLDTPVDVAILGLRWGETVPGAERLTPPLEALMGVLVNREGEIVVAGRVGSVAWSYLERETACRVRIVSEERGMSTAGGGYRARSALGFLCEAVGPARFFERMAELGDVVVLDRRVIESHLGIAASREDRFQGDLLAPERIVDGRLRELVEAAAACPVPVLMGGHSLVSGGLMVLNDVAWEREDEKAVRSGE